MTNDQFDAFISYRREGGSDIARVIQVELSSRYGRKPFLDLKDLTRQGGAFDEKLLDTIQGVSNFILILSPGSLDRCVNEDDWVRKEIAHALSNNLNIIPIELDGFVTPETGIPADIQGMLRIQRVKYDRFYHDAAIQLISDRFIGDGEYAELNPGRDESVNVSERSENFLARGKERLATFDYVEALRYIQMSILCKESSDAHFFAGMALVAILESPSSAKREFEKCLALDGDYADAKLALDYIEDLSEKDDVDSIDRRLLKDKLLESFSQRVANPVPTHLLRVLTPSWAKDWWWIYWIAFASLLFTVTTAWRVQAGDEVRFLPTVTRLIFFCASIYCLNTCTTIFGSLYISLRHMAAPKARNGFDDWFANWMGAIFGIMPNTGGVVGCVANYKHFGQFWLVLFAAVIMVSIAPFFLLFSTEIGIIKFLRWVEFSVTLFPILFVGPCLLLSFLFFKDCSHMPMRPAISASDRDMLRRLSNAFIVGILAVTLCFVLVSLWGLAEFNDDKKQMLFYAITITFGMSWSSLSPIYFSRSITKARDAILSQYGDHIEDALHSFVSDPTENNLSRYRWLLENQVFLDGIQSSLLSGRALGVLISLNAFIIAIAISYPMLKWNVNIYELFSMSFWVQ